MKHRLKNYLQGRYFWWRHDLDVWLWRNVTAPVVGRTPRWLLRLMLVELAVRATRVDLIGPHAYAGPDGVDYERMWHALDGELPPRRVEEIRRSAEARA